MENYNAYFADCDALANDVTSCNVTFVRSLILAAASLDASSDELCGVVRDICTLIDRFTGCGLNFICSQVVKINVKYFG